MPEFVHPRLNEPVTAIGGSYCLTKEARLRYRGREVLYLVGYALVDSSCCGVAGCGYALVPGSVESWKSALSAEGAPVSRVTPIRGPADMAAVARFIVEAEGPIQVRFL